MIFISDDSRLSGVFFGSLVNTTAGDPMNKTGTLITSALLSFGIAAAAMAADAPKAGDTPAASSAPSTTSGKSSKSSSHKHSSHKKKSSSTAAPTTSK